LFSKTSNNAINIITFIASFGVIIGSLALFVVLSGLSGLRTFSYNLLEVSDPDLKITAQKGKSFVITEDFLKSINTTKNIDEYTAVIEERVFLQYSNKNEIAYIKGVESNYTNVNQVDSTLYTGTWLNNEYKNLAVIGNGISRKLSLGILNYGEPLSIMIPKSGTGFINPNNPFYKVDVQVSGIYSGTEEFENKFVFTDISLARKLLKLKKDEVTAIEIKLLTIEDPAVLAKNLQQKLGADFSVKTKAQLNEVYFKVLNTESFIIYLIFILIIIIALFNLIGAIIMMIIDKKSNLNTLYNLGVTVEKIKSIFVIQGFLLTFFGMLIGLSLGVVLVLIQKKFGLFMITQTLAYPIEFQFKNLFIVIATITILGFLASKIASSRISKRFVELN
jgi:lipoprotein-releasing system permease protein